MMNAEQYVAKIEHQSKRGFIPRARKTAGGGRQEERQ